MTDLRVSFPRPCDEKWENMTPVAGCDRVCARCDRVIHDLSQYAVEQVEDLVRADPEACVRAQVRADGAVVLHPGQSLRRMILAAGASAGLLMSAPPAAAGQDGPAGAIVGRITGYDRGTDVVAKGLDGTLYSSRVDDDGSYRIGGLPDGKYQLTFRSCDNKKTIDVVVAAGAEAKVADHPEAECSTIIIGKLVIDHGTRVG